MTTVNVRYIVDDVDAAIAFYGERLGFDVAMHPAPGFAILSRGDLRLMVNAPGGGGGAGQPMPDGRVPEPGGWNRIQLEVDDLAREVDSPASTPSASSATRSADRKGRQADPARRPVRQPGRAVRAGLSDAGAQSPVGATPSASTMRIAVRTGARVRSDNAVGTV